MSRNRTSKPASFLCEKIPAHMWHLPDANEYSLMTPVLSISHIKERLEVLLRQAFPAV